MAVKKIYDMCAKIGEYEKDGVKKNKYMNIGKMFIMDDNSFFSKLDATPLNWDGTISYFEQKERTENSTPHHSAPTPQEIESNDGLPF